MNTPLSAEAALDRYFLETRCKIIEIAASLDRFDRGDGDLSNDPRMKRIHEAVQVLLTDNSDRAERSQQVFSLPYEENWPVPNAK
ncbi:MAG: hypothetical protein ACE5EQ_04850 [Phycisphaerae bacterium]